MGKRDTGEILTCMTLKPWRHHEDQQRTLFPRAQDRLDETYRRVAPRDTTTAMVTSSLGRGQLGLPSSDLDNLDMTIGVV